MAQCWEHFIPSIGRGSISRPSVIMWVEFVGSLHCSESFFLRYSTPVFPSPQKPTFDLEQMNDRVQCEVLIFYPFTMWVLALLMELGPHKDRGKLLPGWELNPRPWGLIPVAPPTELQGQMGAGHGKWRCQLHGNEYVVQWRVTFITNSQH